MSARKAQPSKKNTGMARNPSQHGSQPESSKKPDWRLIASANEASMIRFEQLLEKSEATMLEHAKVVTELTEALAAKDKELERDARAFAAFDGERTFLWEEYDRFRNRLMDYIRWEMMLPESARVALNKVRAQEFEDKLDDDARGDS